MTNSCISYTFSDSICFIVNSYAGDYLPDLAVNILTGDNQNLKNNLEGILLGNPTMSCPRWKKQRRDYILDNMFWHGLVSMEERVRVLHHATVSVIIIAHF